MFFPIPANDLYASSVSLLLPMEGPNGSTTFTDLSGTPKTVTRYGDTKISTAQSKWGNGSGYFDGQGDYLLVPHDNTLLLDGDFTIEWFVMLSAYANTNTWPRILAKQEDVSGGMVVFYDSSGVCIAKFDGSISVIVGTLPLAAWAHVAIVRAGTQVKTYLNGVTSFSGTVSGTVGGSYPIYIGQSVNGGWVANGYLQDLRITKGIARYTANFTPPGPLRARSYMTVAIPHFQPSAHLAAWRGL